MRHEIIPPATARTRGRPVPHSTATAEVKARFDKELEIVTFYCRERGHRLFDYHADLASEAYYEDHYEVVVHEVVVHGSVVEKLCPRCKLLNSHPITRQRGVKAGDGGRWTCENCGAFLATIDAIRGRLILRCRCGEQRVAVPEALDTMANPPPCVEPNGVAFDDIDDAPF